MNAFLYPQMRLGQISTDEPLVAIPQSQVRFHQFWEAASVFVQVPFMLYLSTRKELPTWARVGTFSIAALALYVDGGLLLKWRKR